MATFTNLLSCCLTPTPADDPALRPYPLRKWRGIPATFASMIMTDGRTSHIGIYRGLVVGAPGHRYINMNAQTCVHVATVTVENDPDHVATVNRLATQYQTAEWPAADWSK